VLAKSEPHGQYADMTAAEIIEEIKRLPPKELIEVIKFAVELARERRQDLRYADDADLQKAVDHIFTEYADLMRKLAS
jgi:hypothetical protein